METLAHKSFGEDERTTWHSLLLPYSVLSPAACPLPPL